MISITEISEKLQISKSTVYRFIKDNEITHSAKDGRTFLYDTKAFETISEGLKDNSLNSDEFKNDFTEKIEKEERDNINDNIMNFEFMKSEIEFKNNQIEELTEMNKALNVTLQQQQQLLLYEQQKNTKLLEESIENKKWWQWWK
ncbi:helix-turn-helix domain-containing protein [Vagococcus fluvialis]|uniref:helix-turn-helix domain-containing protein n=2 Tax=Vagococcus fluvialis TaxID=2738 RepID=UPI0037DC0EB4